MSEPIQIQKTARNGSSPALSVILCIGGQRERAGRALRSLLEQSAIDQMEILLFDLGPEGSPKLPGSDHPKVILERSGPNDLLNAARVRGIHAAKSPVIGLMEEHCEMQSGWAEAIIADHCEPWAAVGTDFINGNPDAGMSNTAFRMNYGPYFRPASVRGPVQLIPGHNCSYKRDVLLRYEPNLQLLLSAELILPRRIQEDGGQLFYDPTVRIAHLSETSFRTLAVGLFYWTWCYSKVRAQVYNWTPLRRWTQILLSPAIPWVRLFRLFRQAIRTVPFLQFLRDTPLIVAISYCGAAGQVFGLLDRGEHGFRKLAHFEINAPRLTCAELAK